VRGLVGTTVLITRPKHQAGELNQAILDAGGSTVLFPTLAIKKTSSIPQEDFDVVIFNSANGVYRGLETETKLNSTIIAMGPGTQKALKNKGFDSLIPAPPFNSESILNMPALSNIKNKKVLLVAGVGGRGLLVPALKGRGAIVTKAEVYQRVKPNPDISVLDNFWASDKKIITVTSVETLENLITLVPTADHAKLFTTPILVASARIASCDVIKQFNEVLEADSAANASIVERLLHWY